MSTITSTSLGSVNYFNEILQECDIQLQTGDTPHRTTEAQSIIIREMEKKFKEDLIFPRNVENFFKGLKALCEDEDEYRKALLNTVYQSATETTPIQQDSIFRIFLNIGCLQSSVIEMLLDSLTNLACEESDDTSMLLLIVKALRFLPFINEPAQFTTKILDLIEIANLNMQRELLSNVSQLIPDNQFDNAAKQLSQLLEEHDELSGSIIDCLIAFNISVDARQHIQDHIIDRLLTSTRYYKIFPILFEFLISECKPECIVHVLLKTRETMDNIMRAEAAESISYKALTFRKLECVANDERLLFDGFINTIGTIKVNQDHKPVDALVLFMLHSTCKGKKKIIETVFKKRVKGNLFNSLLFERLFTKYLVKQIFDDYFVSMVEIAGVLLKGQDFSSIEMASLIYKLLFTNNLCSRAQRQDILYNLMIIMGMRDSKNTSVVLNIMHGLSGEQSLQDHAVQLMGLLENIDVLDLKDVKQLFEVLCSVTCGEGSAELGLKDELHMFTRKQLSSHQKSVKQKGIISAVVFAKHIASVTEHESILNDESIDSIDNLPEGPGKEAASLLVRANHCAKVLPETLGLYYDELSSLIVSVPHLNSFFLSWLFDTVTNDFQSMFIVESQPEPINDIKLTSQYSLNSDSEVEEFLAVNIGELAIKERFSQNSTIIILAPIFRLLRLLHHKQNNGDLSSIDALVGCAVIMPEYDSIDDLHTDQIKQVADCIYHCINWFREIISAFSTQNLKRVRAKVIPRLMELIKLEEILDECMDNVPDHKLPTSCFTTLSQKAPGSPTKKDPRGTAKPPKKKLKSAAVILNDTLPSTSATAKSNLGRPPTKKRIAKMEVGYKFREMDTDIIVLLKYPLTITRNIDSNNDSPTPTLHVKQFQFLLNDLIQKLNALTTMKLSTLSHLNIVDPVNLITDCRRFIPNIQKKAKVIVSEIEVLLQSVDDRHEVPEMFTDEAEDLKKSYGLVLEFYSVIFRWPGFQQVKHQALLKDCIKSIRQTDLSQSLVPISKHIIDFINILCQSINQCLVLSSAVCMIQIMQALYEIQMIPEVRKFIVTSSEKFLKRKWFTSKGKQETGKMAFVNIDVLVKAYLSDANVKTICGLVGTLQEEAPKLKSRDDYLLMLGSIDKPNFHILYRGLCTALSDRVKKEVSALTNNEHLILWKTTALTMQGLMTIVKVQKTKSNLSCFLRKSISILKVFLSHGIPILEIMLRSKPDRVREIFKIIQTSTRFLHHLCCYSKNMKDFSLIPLVPQFRLTLETLLYRVKAALTANNCSAAFWMGNLKNKDLYGDDILSQSTTTDSVVEEEELPMEDSDTDLEVNVNEEEETTASEVFDLEF